MVARIIDGKGIAQALRADIKQRVTQRREQGKRAPGLAVVMVGDNPASQVYVRNKRQACAETGIREFSHDLPADTSQAALLQLIDALNANPDVDGILIQLPLPSQVDQTTIIERIDPA
jgi:methylenetetrahydrofolate dehydrogenase (NADP+)/methenyltetrahydrofolate cyclohydrolase